MQDDISLDYDPAHNRDYWQRRPVAVVQRGMQIAGAFGVWFLRGKLQSQRLEAADSKARFQAEQLRHILTRLGPAFVKIGQVSGRSCSSRSSANTTSMRGGAQVQDVQRQCSRNPHPVVLQWKQAVSSRPDVVPPLYLRELEKLQDQIPPFPNDDAFAVIQLETGQPPAGMFSELGATTIAAASLGQVCGPSVVCTLCNITACTSRAVGAGKHHHGCSIPLGPVWAMKPAREPSELHLLRSMASI